jgi:homoserine dehydrogenase
VPEDVSIGLLGLGNVGNGVVRATRLAADVLRARGLRVRVEAALVRDESRARSEGAHVPLVTASVPAFFARRYDAVVEVLGGVEPAASLVARLLESGTPVITANKSLLAARGGTLATLAKTRNTHLLFEASVVAGVPFLDAIARRPLAGAIDRIEAILNGTSNFIISVMESEGASLDEALARAQALGYAEPDPRNDVSGRDAAEKLCVLLRHLGIADVAPHRIRTAPLTGIGPEDVERARRAGGALKPIARATRLPDGSIAASVGPEVLPGDHPLARVRGALNGVLLESRFAGPLFYSGPGAGPDVTAATILDDLATLVDAGALRPTAAARV